MPKYTHEITTKRAKNDFGRVITGSYGCHVFKCMKTPMVPLRQFVLHQHHFKRLCGPAFAAIEVKNAPTPHLGDAIRRSKKLVSRI